MEIGRRAKAARRNKKPREPERVKGGGQTIILSGCILFDKKNAFILAKQNYKNIGRRILALLLNGFENI